MAAFMAQSFTTCHTTRSVTPAPQILPARQTHRKTRPSLAPADASHESIALLPNPEQAPSGYDGPCRPYQRLPSGPPDVEDAQRPLLPLLSGAARIPRESRAAPDLACL